MLFFYKKVVYMKVVLDCSKSSESSNTGFLRAKKVDKVILDFFV